MDPQPPLPPADWRRAAPSPAGGEGKIGEPPTVSSPLAGEEGARARKGVGRRGGQHDLLHLAKRMRREPTEAERRLWQELRACRLGGFKFRRQEQIGDYLVDFVCYSARLIVEADGSQHADGADAVRDTWLEAQGFRMLRLWNNEILTNIAGCGAAILAALETPHPNPSPARGEGL